MADAEHRIESTADHANSPPGGYCAALSSGARSGVSPDDRSAPFRMIPDGKENIIWEQWKYRHAFFWKAFYVVTVTTAFISTVPLFKADLLGSLGYVSLAFPLLGLVFGCFARSLLNAEYKRLHVVGDEYSISPWSYGTSKQPPYRTSVGVSVGELLRPAMLAALILAPLVAFAATLYLLLSQ